MPIDVQCQACKQKLRVADTYAGKKAKCPKCKAIIQIPSASKDAWYVQTPDSQQYGPITKAELDSWVAEGRVDHECQVLQEGWEQWKWADEVYPDIAPAESGGGEFEFPQLGGEPAASPYASPATSSTAAPSSASEAYTPRMVRALSETKPWAMLVSILSMVGGGFAEIGVLYALFLSLGAGQPFMILLFLAYAALIGLLIYANVHLFRYAGAITVFVHTRGARELERAMIAQQKYWFFAGLFMAIMLALFVLGMIISAVTAGSIMRGMPM